MLSCEKCGFKNSDEANFCSRCGSRLTRTGLADTTVTFSPLAEASEAQTPPAERSLETPSLVVRAGAGREGERACIEGDLLTIGRNPESHLFLDDVTVSRHHARVIRDASGFFIEDLNSLNGTYVNRRRVERQRLNDGDELQIGKFKLAFREPHA